ncbi:two-component system sensor protein [Xanthomonas arboricola pv. pruni str. MAFF 311562]|uniref:Two-component system sensor protein n=1 Tax=Xanthomonas arboricola pv. pruni str. MAFF 311562 TaxID=1414836 RepID=W4RZD0_9XANT|nr:two-component system sensor protein [Xanthomonas arboricola pv. pruni str. MAFF 311562]
MLGYLSHTRVLRFAGLFTWAMIAMPLVYTYWPAAEEGDHRSVAEGLLMSAFFVGFGASYFWLTRGLSSGGHAHWYDRLILLLLTIFALAVELAVRHAVPATGCAACCERLNQYGGQLEIR